MNSNSHRLIILICFTLLIACKKKDSQAPAITKEVPVVIVPVGEKQLFPITLESDKATINFKYLQQTGNLTEITSSDGTRELYLYNENNQLKEYDRYVKAEKIYALYYIRDKQGNVIQANQNKVEYNGAVLTPTGTYKIEYNADNKISKVTWYDNNDHVLTESVRSYSASGALLNISSTGQNMTVFNFTFDDKIGWCKQVNFNQILSIESLNSLFLSSVGNMTESSIESVIASKISNSYTYNSDNYPVSWIQTDAKGVKTSYKITYR
jgi:hypothetical protein